MRDAASTGGALLAEGDATRRSAEEARIALWRTSSPLDASEWFSSWFVQKEKPCVAKSAVRRVTRSTYSRAEKMKSKKAFSLFTNLPTRSCPTCKRPHIRRYSLTTSTMTHFYVVFFKSIIDGSRCLGLMFASAVVPVDADFLPMYAPSLPLTASS